MVLSFNLEPSRAVLWGTLGSVVDQLQKAERQMLIVLLTG